VTTFRYDPYGGGSIAYSLALRQPAGDVETAVAAGAAQSTHFRAFAPRYLPADGRAAQLEASSPAVGGRDLLPRPMPLVSTASALIGHHWLIIGGFSNRHRERGEVWCLDLAASVSLAARRPQALRHGPHSHLRPETFLPPADGAAAAAAGPVPGVGVARKAENVNVNVSLQLHTQYRHREDEYVDPWDDMGEEDDDEGDEEDEDEDDDEDYDDDGEWHGVLGGHDDDDELGDEEYYDGEEGDEEDDDEDDDDEPENAVVVEEGGDGKAKEVAGGGGAGK
jgi:hypothetical protein